MQTYRYKILKIDGGKSILEYLSSFDLASSKLDYYKKAKITVNGNHEKIDYILKENDILELPDYKELDIKPYNKKLDILYEDDYILLVNKPKNILIHSDDNQNVDNTLANMVANYYISKGWNIPIRYLSRLDKDTTGVIMFIKDPLSLAKLSEERFKKTYLALVSGKMDKDIVINKPIGRNRHINGKYRVSETGKPALTRVHIKKVYKNYTLIEVKIETGRTHQIRVHLSSIGHPLLGDELYNGNINILKTPALHSYSLEFKHPIMYNNMVIFANMPLEMRKLV